MTVFHHLCRDHHEITAPPLDCARSGHLHTICSVVTKDKISSPQLRLLSHNTWPSFHTDRIDRAAVSPTTLADLAATSSTSVCSFLACKLHSSISVCRSFVSADHTSSIRIPRSSPDLEYPAWCLSSFHLTSPRCILVGLFLLTAVI